MHNIRVLMHIMIKNKAKCPSLLQNTVYQVKGGYSCPKLPNPLICFQTWTRLILHGICNFLLKLSMIWSLMVYILLSYIFLHTLLPDYHLCSRIILTNQSNISARLISLWCSCIYVCTSLHWNMIIVAFFMSHKIMFQL